MATQQQIDELTRLFAEARPRQMAAWQQRQAASGSEGMLGVLMCLHRTGGSMTAGEVAKAMRITSGRVSVLTKKLEDKGLVTREPGKEDARVTEVRIADKGRQAIDDLQRRRIAQMEQLIDVVGMERLKEYVEVSKEVWSILTPLEVEL